MNLSRSEIHTLRYAHALDRLRSERAAYAQAIKGVREATGLHDAPLAELPAMVEELLSTLAERQIQRDVEQATEPEPAYDDWAPEDTVVPRPEPSCRGCIRLTEIDGRLMCGEARAKMYGASITWPGPGCVWSGAGDAVYGGGRG
jgi:hypothetical protein